MYLLALDESGTHGGAPVLLVAGIAVHEADVRPLEAAVHLVVAKHLAPLRLNPHEHEVHASDLKTPARARPPRPPYRATPASPWLGIDASVRLAVLADVYGAVASYQPLDPRFPVRVFGAVVDRVHKRYGAANRAEPYAYDHALHRFAEMLTRVSLDTGITERGLVIHDRRDSVDNRGNERRIQEDAAKALRRGRKLNSLLQVPVFIDSNASRLVQVADFVAYALWRHYQPTPDPTYSSSVWPLVDVSDEKGMSGVIHVTPKFGECPCPPCNSRRQ